MNEFEKAFLNVCIYKHRKKKYTQQQLSEGICTKYTLSRLENGLLCKDKIYLQLLDRLGFYYEDHPDSLTVYVLIQDTLLQLETHHNDKVIQNILAIETILEAHPNNIFAVELQYYIHLMHIHYIDKQPITLHFNELITLSHFQNDFYIIFMHTICENLVFHYHIKTFIAFIETYKKEIHHVLLDYHVMKSYQIRSYVVDCDAIFKQYKNKFIENNEHIHYFHYATTNALAYIHCDIHYALQLFEHLYKLAKKLTLHPFYRSHMYLGFVYIYTLTQAYDKALIYIEEAYFTCDTFFNSFIPYASFLYLHSEKPMPAEYFIANPSPISSYCLQYYTMRKSQQGKVLIDFLSKHLLSYCSYHTIRSPFPTLIRNEIMCIMENGKCYRSALRLDTLLKETCR